MDDILLLGLLAGTLTTIAYIPQAIRIWRTRSSKDVSRTMYVIVCAGLFLWIIYGVYDRSLPLIVANIVSLAVAAITLLLKQRYG
jgi:MtN3 and saliva related transmembrane protein